MGSDVANHITVTFQGQPRSKVMVPYESMFPSMNNSNYMSNRNRYKDIGTCLSQIPLHVYATKMQSFINLGLNIFLFCDVIFSL